MKQLKKLPKLGVLLTLFPIAGCATSTFVTDAKLSCKTFKPIHASNKDTTPTKREIVEHNRSYDAICPKGTFNG